MNDTNDKQTDQVWDLIDREKKRDKMIRRISRVAWGATLVMLLVFLTFTLIDLSRQMDLYSKGIIPYASVLNAVVPFAVILGSLSLIIAILSTVGVFLRLRTTSLLEVQQRLANLEQMVLNNK
ncbi:MAG: hypothetical protein HEP71_06440 [Roseivirga sp.]|nr:hypothetical protein [Roseivirga sp.]